MSFIQRCCERGAKSHVAKKRSGRTLRRSRDEKDNQGIGDFRFTIILQLFSVYFFSITSLYHIFSILFFTQDNLSTPTPTTTTTHDLYPLPTTHDTRHLPTLFGIPYFQSDLEIGG